MSAEPVPSPDSHARRRGGTPVADRVDRVHWFAGRVHEVLDGLGDPYPLGLTPAQTAEAVAALRDGLLRRPPQEPLERAAARLSGLALRLVARADLEGLAGPAGATSTAAWVRGLVPVTRRGAVGRERLAESLRDGHQAVDAALVAGEVLPDQARAVCDAVDDLPVEVGVDTRRAAEAHLLDLAQRFDAVELARLGKRILHVVAPELAERLDAAALDREERQAERATSLTWGRDGHGSVNGRFKLPERYGEMLAAALDAFTNPAGVDPVPHTHPAHPTHPADTTESTAASAGEAGAGCAPDPAERVRRLTPVIRGEAFCRLLETLNADTLPATGGLAPTVVVTMTLDTLLGGLAHAAIVGTPTLLTPGEARRLACAAGVIPAVLDGQGRVLDLGRRRRLASKAQILALRVQQHGVCAITGCDRPARWCEAHHWRRSWATGGTTNLADLALICPRHHTLAHRHGMTMTPAHNGKFQLHRRT